MAVFFSSLRWNVVQDGSAERSPESDLNQIQTSCSKKHTPGKNEGCVLSTRFAATRHLEHLVQIMPVAMAAYSRLLGGSPVGEIPAFATSRRSYLPKTIYLYIF